MRRKRRACDGSQGHLATNSPHGQGQTWDKGVTSVPSTGLSTTKQCVLLCCYQVFPNEETLIEHLCWASRMGLYPLACAGCADGTEEPTTPWGRERGQTKCGETRPGEERLCLGRYRSARRQNRIRGRERGL